MLGLLFIAILGVAAIGTTVYGMQVWTTSVPTTGTTVTINTQMPLYADAGGFQRLSALNLGACESGQTSSTGFFWVKNPNTVPVECTGWNVTGWNPAGANAITVTCTGWETALVAGGMREIDVDVTLPVGFSIPSWSFTLNRKSVV